MNNRLVVVAVAIVAILGVGTYAGFYYFSNQSASACSPSSQSLTSTSTQTPTSTAQSSTSGGSSTVKLQVVAAENFWGSLVSQLGGKYVHVLSIVSDPNADPHEYESNTFDAQAIANANYVIVNGAGYDTWALNLIAASNTKGQAVLNVQELIHQPIDANPHFWYSPYYVNDTVKAMYQNLTALDPSDATYYATQYANLNASLGQYNAQIGQIKQQFAGVKVASTEDIFVYLANATGLDLISPPAFMQAVAEGNDPPAQSVAQFQNQIQNGSVSLLVYNEQTVTPLTQTMKCLAAQKGIPIVGVTETIQPPNAQFQTWMLGELYQLQNGLNAQALGH
jgi:zinc/manganese transport system substrate-binding protein